MPRFRLYLLRLTYHQEMNVLHMRFSRYSAQQDSLAVFPFLSLSYCPLTDVLSAIRRYKSLYPLITGKTSYPNSASPLMWVTPFLVPFYLIAFSPAPVSSIVSSAASVLTVVFGMGTGVSPKRIATGNLLLSTFPLITQQ